ncbi:MULTISPECIES: hypothetical protein [Kaistia]|uniref:2OG-Fe(II) oxygenase n=1 Tax=Kaistia nematophila TaxID=2994654 RepID=A0A9X3E349_9HYPH|nr:hypothetical protein [Hyphomicrobiales bacterium]MCX5570894.1 hypothetical protein [Kaistia nematophila]
MLKSAHTDLNYLTSHIAQAIRSAEAFEEPFYHLVLDGIFPADVYAEMQELMPSAGHFRALAGRGNVNIRNDGSSTRVKVDLFPEYLRHLEGRRKTLWNLVGAALCSDVVRDAFVERLGPGLKRRFGSAYKPTDFFPIPMLTRDTSGYRIAEHTDTHWKGITVQLYLPRDESLNGVGTVFSSRGADGKFTRVKQMDFIPNHGYAFAVGDNTWHSVDPTGELPMSRDSILHTYFVDQTAFQKARNRGKRVGNFLKNEFRQLGGG